MTSFSLALLKQLREHTLDQHRAIERQKLVRELMAPGVGMQTYSAVLQRFFHFYADLETKLIPALHEFWISFPQAEYFYVPRSQLLKQDLADLSVSPQHLEGVATLSLPATSFPGAILGVLYVLEGSTQGGRVIGPHLTRSLGVSPSRGGRFFNLHAATDSGWLGYQQLLGTLHADPSIIAPAVRAARDTFEGLHTYMEASFNMEQQPI